MNVSLREPDETDLGYESRIAYLVCSLQNDNAILRARVRILELKLQRAAEFDLSADANLPALLRRQA